MDTNIYVFRNLINHSLIFKTRQDVLIHSLLVLGNGIDWQADGSLDNKSIFKLDSVKDALAALDKDQKEYTEQIRESSSSYQVLDDYLKDENSDPEVVAMIQEMAAKVESDIVERYDEQRQVIRNAEKLAFKKAEPIASVEDAYAGSAYADDFSPRYINFFNAPANVAEDWRQAMYEIVDYIQHINPYHQLYVEWLEAWEEWRVDGDHTKLQNTTAKLVERRNEMALTMKESEEIS